MIYATAEEFLGYIAKLTQYSYEEIEKLEKLEFTPEQEYIYWGIVSICLIGKGYGSGLERMKKDYSKVLVDGKFIGKGKPGRNKLKFKEKMKNYQNFFKIKALIDQGKIKQNKACKKIGMSSKVYRDYRDHWFPKSKSS